MRETQPPGAAPTTPARPSLEAQAHGGALLRGGLPGNKGGRPPSALRTVAGKALVKRIPLLIAIADDPTNSPFDRTKALSLLAQYAQHTRVALEVAAVAIREKYPPTLAREILAVITEAVNAIAPDPAER